MTAINSLNRIVYLDNSATTRVSPLAAEKALYMMTENFGNSSSLHTLGIEAEKELERAREITAQLLGCDCGSVYFTSGGTEGNNLAIFGAVKALRRLGKHIITTTVEHPSVYQPIAELETGGYEVSRLTPRIDGNFTISPDEVLNLCREDTVLISIMMVNNETGAIFPVEEIARAVKRRFPRTLIHCDAVQGVGKRKIDLFNSDIDILTFSGHKMHAPKGIGGIYLKKKARILPLIFGGGQEKNLRSGTESTPLIAALGAAIENSINFKSPEKLDAHFRQLHSHALSELSKLPQIKLNSAVDTARSVPYIINFSVSGIRSEIMLHHLASKNVFVSSGSACAKGRGSKVLEAMGIAKNLADSALRISFSEHTTLDEIDIFISSLKMGIENLLKS